MEIDEDSQVTAQIQARFEKATIANEILDILDHADSFRILVSNAKAPFVRKSIIHLSSFAESESAAEYSRALCALAMLWSEKLLRPIVDQLTKRFLTLRMSDCYDALTLDQLVLRTRRDVVDIAFALGRMESMGWVVNNGGWWEVLGAQTPAGYGGIHGGSNRLGD